MSAAGKAADEATGTQRKVSKRAETPEEAQEYAKLSNDPSDGRPTPAEKAAMQVLAVNNNVYPVLLPDGASAEQVHNLKESIDALVEALVKEIDEG